MTFSAEIKVMPLKELLDPQGKAILSGLHHLGITEITDIRVGKNMLLQLNTSSKEEAYELANKAAKKLLANQVMEEFTIDIFST